MNYLGHAASTGAVAAWSIPLVELAVRRPLTLLESVAWVSVAVACSQLPDVDHPKSMVTRLYGPLSGLISRVTRWLTSHRGATHSVAAALVVAAVVAWSMTTRFGPAVVVGFAASLALAALDPVLPGDQRAPVVNWSFGAVAGGLTFLAAPALGPVAVAAGVGMLSHRLGDEATTRGSFGLFDAGGRVERVVVIPLSFGLFGWFLVQRAGLVWPFLT